MKNKRLDYLLQCYLGKTITAAEEAELFELLGSANHDEQVRVFMEQTWNQEIDVQAMDNVQSSRILSSILERRDAADTPVIPFRQSFFRRPAVRVAAAVAILAVSVLAIYLVNNRPSGEQPIAQNPPAKTYKNDVSPGSTGAILKLADGRSIILDSAQDGQLATEANMQVIKQGGSLQYVGRKGTDEELSYNLIETPRGRQYQLSLEDGTKVWLNAASSIRFPVAFAGTERKVEITGEVYFEVAKDKTKPFRVEARGTTVEVLGTHFNVNSYADEESINTTLLEGSVKVSKGGQQKIIKPGQQAQVDAKGDMKTNQNISLAEVMAWKDNTFSFDHTDIKKLMRQLSRWYDVEIVFENNTPDPVAFIGGISRSVNLSTVLAMLEQTGEVKFSIEGKKIIVRS
jgi:transmembrane sensor